jgi:hypothetical protein
MICRFCNKEIIHYYDAKYGGSAIIACFNHGNEIEIDYLENPDLIMVWYNAFYISTILGSDKSQFKNCRNNFSIDIEKFSVLEHSLEEIIRKIKIIAIMR